MALQPKPIYGSILFSDHQISFICFRLESNSLHLYSSLPDSQGMLLAKDIRDRERGGRAQVRVIEGEAESGSPESMEMLSGVFGQRNFELMDGPPDEATDQEQKSKLKLYQ